MNSPAAQQSAIKLALRDFKLSGVALEGRSEKALCGNFCAPVPIVFRFSNHVLDATQAYFRPLNEDELAGLSANNIELLKQYGKQHELDQPVATLDFPSYLAIMTHAKIVLCVKSSIRRM